MVGVAIALIAIVLYRVTPRGTIDLSIALALGIGVGLVGPLPRSQRRISVQNGGRDLVIGALGSLLCGGLVLWVAGNDPTVQWFGHIVTHGDRHDQRVALTFDDGPDDPFSLQVSAVLDAHGAKVFLSPGLVYDLHEQQLDVDQQGDEVNFFVERRKET